MSEIKFQKDNKGNVTGVILTGVTFYYTNIKTPRPVYDDRNKPIKQARKEYSVEVAVTEDIADAWDEVFTKQPSKKYTNAKFMEKYKLEDASELPFPKEKKQFTIKVTQKLLKNDGEPIGDSLIPRVLIADPENPKKGKDITFTTNIGNGSKGILGVRAITNSDYGTFAYLSKMKVEDLVEYESTASGGMSEGEAEAFGFDEVDLDDAPTREPVSGGDDDSDDSDDQPDDDNPFDDDDEDYA